jgi:hypothetical protein
MGRAAGRIGAVVLVVLAVSGGSAQAVDVVNRDKVPREIVVNSSDGRSTLVTVPPRETVAAVCDACVILSGDTSVEASGGVTVRIEGGKVSIGSKR